MSVNKWRIYCVSEQKYIEGYIDDYDGIPAKCFDNEQHTIDTSKSTIIEKISSNFTHDLTKWKIFCDTEDIYTYGYSTELPYPERCFNNINHVISKKPIPLKTIKNSEIKIKEEYGNTGGYFQSVSYKFECGVGETVNDYTYPYNISAFLVSFKTIEENRDDLLEIEVAPETIIGCITSDISSPGNILQVSESVIENCSIGFFISITDGVNNEDLGNITSIDILNSTISTSTSSSLNFLASSPTYVKITVKTISNFIIGHPGDYIIGSSKIGGSSIPANTILRMKYMNNGPIPKNFYIYIELLY